MSVDLAVIGAGPAGGNAALEAARHGLSVTLIEESQAPGGQVWRAPAPGLAAGSDADAKAGAALRAAIAAAPLTCLQGARVWLIGRTRAGFRIDLVRDGASEAIETRALLLATGAHERVVPFPGWTLPGVIGLAGATILLKSQKMLPGRRTVVAGCGPLLSVVAAGILKAGGKVVALVDLDSRADWLAALPALAARPDLLARGAGWALSILRAGVPRFARHTVVAADGDQALAGVSIAPCDEDGVPVAGAAPRRFEADALAIGHGLVPDTAATRLVGAEHHFDAGRGGWHGVRDADMRSSLDGVWLAGEAGGIGGAAVAALSGRLAGAAVAHAAGRLDAASYAALAAPLRGQLARAGRAGGAMARMMRPRAGMAGAIPPETVVCRCEDVTRAEIDAAIAAGAREVNQLKQWTRCGMGPCQGRMCGEAAAGILADHVGGREAAGLWTGRAPLRPVPMAALLGQFDYADIPIPPPAPP
ncbi:MAG: FAD-dependent oxidoreductase [Acetobacteraceae bacterium]|nr:FAD-dependent oxidoreductase [Acetobacteraceae bacterium]